MNWKVSWTIFHVSDVVQTGSEPDGILRKLCLGWQKIGGASQRLQLWKAICKGFIWSRGSSIFWQHFLFGNSKSLREPWNWLVCFITVLAQKLNRNCMDSCQFVFFSWQGRCCWSTAEPADGEEWLLGDLNVHDTVTKGDGRWASVTIIITCKGSFVTMYHPPR